MTVENFDRALRIFIDRKPFEVFMVELHGGQRLEVDHPGAMLFRDGSAFFFAPGGIPVLFDRNRVNQTFGAPANTAFQDPS